MTNWLMPDLFVFFQELFYTGNRQEDTEVAEAVSELLSEIK